MKFSNLTLEQIDMLDKEILKKLSMEDFADFCKRNVELGREYLVGGKKSRIDEGEPDYSKGCKALEKNRDGTWGIGIWMCGPTYLENPDVVDEETFKKTMLELGVSKEKLDEFITYEINWDDL